MSSMVNFRHPTRHREFLFRFTKSKAMWLVDNNIAYWANNQQSRAIVQDSKRGWELCKNPDFFDSRMEICECCGGRGKHTIHHIIPQRYMIPGESDGRTAREFRICFDCHGRYEDAAKRLDERLRAHYGLPPASLVREQHDYVTKHRGIQAALESGRLSEEKAAPLRQWIAENPLPEVIYSERSTSVLGIVTQATAAGELDKLVALWKGHFMAVMQPQFIKESQLHWIATIPKEWNYING
jgi:hypothetical protein